MDCAKSELAGWLTELCLNPEIRLNAPPVWFHDIERSLKDYIEDRRLDRQAGKIVTSIGAQINDALDYAFEERCMVHINGVARMGKTFQVQQWCQNYPGRVRYIQVPSGNDEISFYRAIARSLGTACGSSMNTTQIKRQVEDAIQDAGIMLVFDEAHYLFPQYKDARNAPRRINWLLTEVVNKGIPVALVTTPQFDFLQKRSLARPGGPLSSLTVEFLIALIFPLRFRNPILRPSQNSIFRRPISRSLKDCAPMLSHPGNLLQALRP